MKTVYIDAQNVHKAIEWLGWIIDREKFYNYLKNRFDVDSVKFFVGYLRRYQWFYNKLFKR